MERSLGGSKGQTDNGDTKSEKDEVVSKRLGMDLVTDGRCGGRGRRESGEGC